jgi:hypothetical protein
VPFVILVGTVFYIFEVVIVVSIRRSSSPLSAIYIGSAIEPEHWRRVIAAVLCHHRRGEAGKAISRRSASASARSAPASASATSSRP